MTSLTKLKTSHDDNAPPGMSEFCQYISHQNSCTVAAADSSERSDIM
jgi:hypothetical protein